MQASVDTPGKAVKIKKQSNFAEIWRRFKKNKTAMIGLIVFAFLLLIMIFADLITPYENTLEQSAELRLATPSWGHILGGDNLGRDIFARIVHGSRISMSAGIIVSLVSTILAGLLGSAAGYYGGKVDSVIMRILDVFTCIPPLLLALAVVAALGANLVNTFIALTISSIPGKTRLVRSSVLTVVDSDYIEAARSYGARDMRIILKYVIPNALGPIIVESTMSMSGLILAAAGLSFLGMGAQPPAPEWGAMLSNARDFMRTAGHLLYAPGIAILLASLSINLVGDGLRDALDPKLKN